MDISLLTDHGVGAVPSPTTVVGQTAADTGESFFNVLRSKQGSLTPSAQEPPNQGLLHDPSIKSLFEELTGRPPAYEGEPIRLEDIRAHALRVRADFRSRLDQRLSEAGIDTTNIRLQSRRGDGKVIVVGDHPDAAAIEAIIEEDQTLTDTFHKLDSMHSMLHRADEHAEFAAAYARDPIAAVAQYAHLFNEFNSPTFELLVDGPTTQVSFV